MPRIKAGSIELNYDTFGNGEPLLLIMGFGMPGIAWLPSLPMLAGFRCIYFDNRGTGYSDKPDGTYTIEQMADDASNLLRALNIPTAKVFGVSMGGMIAQELTLRHPEQVAKVVLGCTLPGGPESKMAAPQVAMKLVEGTRLMASNPDQGLDVILPLLYPEEFARAHPEIKPMMLAGMKMMPATPSETVDRTIAGIMTFNASERLGQIKCPVLIVHGEQDLLIPPSNAALLKRGIPRAEVYMIPNAGHAFQAADPIRIHQRIVQFLKS
jgi:pimeloyl-ACP methyl ester carboxylesterase